MDYLDKLILFHLFRDGRISQNKLAALLNLSVPSLNSRYKKLVDDNIIRGFRLFINPNLLGYIFSYAAFQNINSYDADYVFVIFKCLENFDVYGIYASNSLELDDYMQTLSARLGNPIMIYSPYQNPLKLNKIDLKLLSVLNEYPRATIGELAEKTGIKASKINKILELLKGKIAVIPDVDLVKADIILLGIFTSKIEQVKTITSNKSIITIRGPQSGVEICFIDSIGNAKNMVERIKKIDSGSQIMLVYEYRIKPLKNFY